MNLVLYVQLWFSVTITLLIQIPHEYYDYNMLLA
jgi:hypothetical protein